MAASALPRYCARRAAAPPGNSGAPMTVSNGAARDQPPLADPALRRFMRNLAWHRLIPSWPLIVGLAAFFRLLIERMSLLNDPDTYLHIAAGRWALAHARTAIRWATPYNQLATEVRFRMDAALRTRTRNVA